MEANSLLGWRAAALMAVLALSACRGGAVDSSEELARGRALWEAQRFAEATEAFSRAVQADPENGQARLKLAEGLWKIEKWDAGAREAIRAADLLPDDIEAQQLGATRSLSLQRFDEAAARANRVLALRPLHVPALLILGNASARLLDSTWALFVLRSKASNKEAFETALRDVRPPTSSAQDAVAERVFRQALTLEPGGFETRVALVNFLWAANRQDEAAPSLEILADEYKGHLVISHALGAYFLSRGRRADGERYLQHAAASGDRETALALAELYESDGRAADALALLDKLADTPPGSVSLRRAEIEFRQGQRDAAMARVERLLNANPKHAGALEAKAGFQLGMGKGQDGMRTARLAVDTAPTSAQAHYLLGQGLVADGRPDEAFAEFSEAVRLNPGHRLASKALARGALASRRAAVASELLRALTRADPSDLEATVMLAAALLQQGDTRATATLLETALARFPRSAALLARRGDLLAAQRDPGARAAYGQALALDPRSPEAVIGLASFDLAAGRTAAARQLLEQALARDPARVDLLLELGTTLQAAGDSAAAERIYRRVLELVPGDVVAPVELSGILRRTGREADARALLEQVIERRPTAVEPRLALADLFESAGRQAGALEQYQRVLSDDPRSGVAAYRLAALNVERGENLDVALDLAQRAVRALPKDPFANDVLGWIYVRKNLPRLGLPHLEESVGITPDNALFQFHHGVALLAVGQRERGRAALRRSLELAPDSPVASQARSLLTAALR